MYYLHPKIMVVSAFHCIDTSTGTNFGTVSGHCFVAVIRACIWHEIGVFQLNKIHPLCLLVDIFASQWNIFLYSAKENHNKTICFHNEHLWEGVHNKCVVHHVFFASQRQLAEILPSCILKRRHFMVKNSDFCFACKSNKSYLFSISKDISC